MSYAASALAEAMGRSIWPTSDATREAARARLLVSSQATTSLGVLIHSEVQLAVVPGFRRSAQLADVH